MKGKHLIKMTGKWHTCNNCGKTLSSYKSLWRHKNSCMSIPRSLPISEYGNGKREKVDADIFNTIDPQHRNSIPVVSEQNGEFVVEKMVK